MILLTQIWPPHFEHFYHIHFASCSTAVEPTSNPALRVIASTDSCRIKAQIHIQYDFFNRHLSTPNQIHHCGWLFHFAAFGSKPKSTSKLIISINTFQANSKSINAGDPFIQQLWSQSPNPHPIWSLQSTPAKPKTNPSLRATLSPDRCRVNA